MLMKLPEITCLESSLIFYDNNFIFHFVCGSEKNAKILIKVMCSSGVSFSVGRSNCEEGGFLTILFN